jgi:1,2-phenylacetyl-CoA epoxidase PaaB subunit
MTDKHNIIALNAFQRACALRNIKDETNFFRKFNGNDVEIKLIVNGFDCDFIKTIDSFEKSLDEYIEKEANKILKKKFDEQFFNILDEITEVAQDLKGRINDKINGELKYDWEESE